MSTHELTTDSLGQEHLLACESMMLEQLCRPGADQLNNLIHYHLQSGGSRLRARLALETGRALKLPPETCIRLAASCELIHNASLLHDDIQDKSTHRRGQQAAWHRFDANTAMCAGTLMLSAAFDLAARSTPNPARLIAHLHQRTADLIVGQCADLHYDVGSLTVEQYLQIVTGKSGALLALPLELPLIVASAEQALQTATLAGQAFAVAYQIVDDIADMNEDLSHGHCNIIAVLQAQAPGHVVALDQARGEAALLAQAHRQRALECASQLPDHSGQALVTLCHALTLPVCIESSTSCEET